MRLVRPLVALCLCLCLAALACTVAPAGAATTASPAQVSDAKLEGVRQAKPRLTLSVAAREGAGLTNITVEVGVALDVAQQKRTLAAGIVLRSASGSKLKFTATSTPGTIRIRLLSPQPSVNLKIGVPALATTPKLLDHIREGRTRKLGLVVGTRETGGKGTRLPLIVAV